jgi:hypothetical protein
VSVKLILSRISLPFFSPVPPGAPAITGGVSAEAALASPGPYYIAGRVNGEWAILRQNPNYRGPRSGAVDAEPEPSLKKPRPELLPQPGGFEGFPVVSGAVGQRHLAFLSGLRRD